MFFLARKGRAKKTCPRAGFSWGFLETRVFLSLESQKSSCERNKVLKMVDDSQDKLFFGVADPVGDDGMLGLNPHIEYEVFDLVHHGRARHRASGARDTELQRHWLVRPKPGVLRDRSRARKTPSLGHARHRASVTQDTELRARETRSFGRARH